MNRRAASAARVRGSPERPMTTSLPAGADRPAPLLPPNGWRGLARLALEGLAAGLVVSVMLALAVFIVASQAEAAPLHSRTAGVVAADANGGVLRLAENGDEPALAAPLVATDIKVAVAGIVARTTLTQRFVNPTGAWREGVYLFPLPDHAAVDHLRVESDGRVIEGQVQERAAAKKRYDDAKRSGRQAGLVEQERPNLFTTSIALLPPHDEVVVTIEFSRRSPGRPAPSTSAFRSRSRPATCQAAASRPRRSPTSRIRRRASRTPSASSRRSSSTPRARPSPSRSRSTRASRWRASRALRTRSRSSTRATAAPR